MFHPCKGDKSPIVTFKASHLCKLHRLSMPVQFVRTLTKPQSNNTGALRSE